MCIHKGNCNTAQNEQEDNKMDLPFRIKRMDGFRAVGYLLQTTNKKGEGRKQIPLHWSAFSEEKREKVLLDLASEEPQGLFGITIYNTDDTDPRKFEYLIAVSSDCEVPKGMSIYTVPAGTWAIFPCKQETIGKTEAQAITKWLPRSKYRPLNKGYLTGRMKTGAPDIEYYGKDGYAEVWIAVEEK